MMTGRSPETIEAERRAAEALAMQHNPSEALLGRIEQLRREHSAAVRDSRRQADELAFEPGGWGEGA